MTKKGSWFSAIKRFFACQSGEQLPIDPENNSTKEKKGVGKLRHGESNSFIPLFRKPSSVEKIFQDFDREQHIVAFRPPASEPPTTPPYVPPRPVSPSPPSPQVDSPKEASPKNSPPRVASPPEASSSTVVNHHEEIGRRRESPQRDPLSAAIKIQAAYRGYAARRGFKALKGLVRLQGVVRGNNVRRQTMNAKKQMQLLVRVQSQIQSRRIQMLENQRQPNQQNDREVQSTLATSEAGNNVDWDESPLTKEEKEARMQKKVEAAIKRERAKAYAYSQSHQKNALPSAQDVQTDTCSTGVPRWLKWLENQLPPATPAETHLKNSLPRPSTPESEQKSTPQFPSHISRQLYLGMDGRDSPTPKSTKSTVFSSSKPMRSPYRVRTPQTARSNFSSDSRSRAGRPHSPFDMRLNDNDSLVSCPPYMARHYMTPTISAKAKVRARSNPRERFPGTPRSETNRRQSYPLTQNVGSFRNKGDQMIDDSQSLRSVGNSSVVSTASGVGRKPFNRFV